MKTSELRPSVHPVLAFLLVVSLGTLACRDSTPPPYEGIDTESTGGRSGTGGRKGGTATGGAPGAAVPPKGGAPADSGTAPDATAPVASDAPVADVAVSTDVVAAIDVVPAVDAVVVVDVKPPASPPDAAPKGRTACHPDPKVIVICHQLEAACGNCPGGAMGRIRQNCFATVQKGDDAACAKFGADNKCPVDDAAGKGNVCGSLNCGVGNGPPVEPGCNKAMCAKAQGEGNSALCMPFLAACPCQ